MTDKPLIDSQCVEATPRTELIRQVLDPNYPKTEREWAAAHEIERLTRERDEALEILAMALPGPRPWPTEDVEAKLRIYRNMASESWFTVNERLRAALEREVALGNIARAALAGEGK
jgi:predicted NBD/HSP70 family sugar kinase